MGFHGGLLFWDFSVALQKNQVIPVEAHWASVELTSAGRPNDLMATAASYDSTLRYGAQTPFNDQLTFKWEGGEWRVDSTHNSIITAGNGGHVAIKARLTIYYDGGTRRYELEQELKPHEQMWVDVGKLIHNQVPDKNGLMLPSDLMMGSYELEDLTDRGLGNLFEGKVTLDKTFGQAAYGCATCCGYEAPHMYWDPISLLLGVGSNQDVWALDSCSSTDVSVIGYITPSSWGTGNHAIATANGRTITGMGVGSTTNFAQGNLIIGGPETKRCNPVQINPSGPVNVQVPDHLLVQSDVQQTLSCSGNPDQRQITYDIVDANGNQVCALTTVREQFTNRSPNSCGGPVQTTETCTVVSGGFTDTLSPGCVVAGHNTPCGFTADKQQWQWCRPSGTPSIGTPGALVVDTNVISVGGNTLGFPPGYSPPK